MKRLAISMFMLLSCAYQVYAQDSFANPLTFIYEIEYSSEYTDSIVSPSTTRVEVKYDINTRTSICRILYNGELKYSGRILDSRLERDRQTFVLEKYFSNKYNACLLIAKESTEISDTKVGMIYYANQNEDPASEKTCYCLFLKDVDEINRVVNFKELQL